MKCDLDHAIPYPKGSTSEANLGAECRHHHIVKTRGGWSVSQSEPSVFDWESPTGRRYHVASEPPAEVQGPG